MEIENTKRPKQKPAFFVLRAAAAFILLLALIAGLYLIGFRSYRTVAEWGDDGNHATLIYQDETYTLIGAIGDKGLTESKYPIDKILGKVEDDGSVMTDAEVTFPEETVEGETLNVPPPDGTPTLSHEHTYILYSVKKDPEHLLVLEKDGEHYLYRLTDEESTTEAE